MDFISAICFLKRASVIPCGRLLKRIVMDFIVIAFGEVNLQSWRTVINAFLV